MLVPTNPFLGGAPTEPGPAPYTISEQAAKALRLGTGFLAELNARPAKCICRYPLLEAYADCPVHRHDAILNTNP